MSSAKLDTSATHAVQLVRAALMFAAAVAPSVAHADSDTDSFEVTATVLASCDVTADDLTFGDYDPIAAADLDAETSVSVTCTNGTSYNVGMSVGGGSGASMSERFMTKAGGSETLSYVLYQDDQRSVLWGDTGGDRLAGAGDGTPGSIPVYGRIPMQQAAPSGDYSDTIIVTVSW
ncbi:MAG: spore coat U domain-containing protein [Hyphomonadaceae bacterium]